MVALLAAACSTGAGSRPTRHTAATSSSTTTLSSTPSPEAASGSAAPARPRPTPVPVAFRHPLPGMPPVLRNNVYAGAGAGDLSPRVRHDPAL
ncbi:MAG: hypothetical protein QOK15_2914, partial [Nocardioidaceae bacterium]|nr:hypothetical protein [Nocardioidaceae bacterium]